MKQQTFRARDWFILCAFALAISLAALLLTRMGGVGASPGASVVITEIMADNEAAWPSEGVYRDWVEIENTSDEPVDLTGWQIACGVDTRAACDMGLATLAPGERAVLLCAEGTEIDFDLPRSGALISLVEPSGRTADSVLAPAMAEGECWALLGDGEWTLTQEYTPGLSNTKESFLALTRPAADGAVAISELMAKNRSTIADESGAYNDYIELYNASDAPVALDGWHLTDDIANRTRQALSGVTVPAGGCALVYLTGARGSGFALDDAGETVWLTDASGAVVSWAEYEDLGKDEALTLRADGSYTREEAPTPGYRYSLSAARAANTGGNVPLSTNAYGVYINEVAASYSAYYDWVEIENTGTSDFDLSGWGVSDDPDHPRKWQFPDGAKVSAGGYVVVCFVDDGAEIADSGSLYYAEGFALATDGSETVTLCDPDGEITDRIKLAGLSVNVSLGRADGQACYRYFTSPTPGRVNSGTSYAKRAAEVVFSREGGMVGEGPITVELSAEAGATIYYTLDGSEPGASALIYTQPLTVERTTVVRARAVAPDMLDSYIATRTYVIGEETKLRVIAISGDADALTGTDGVLETGKKTDVTVSCEVYDYDGELLISQECRLRTSGHSSRVTLPQKAFTLTARAVFGYARFDAKLFTNRDAQEYNAFVLRASGQDAFQTHMRDSVLTALADGTGLYYQETELASVYVNGRYWGVYNMREHVDEETIARFENAGAGAQVDLLEGGAYTLLGSRESFDAILKKVQEVSLASDEMLAELEKYVDVDNYLTYVAIQMYTANLDLNNLRAYRVGDGRWKWVLYDLDLSFQVDKNTPYIWLNDDGVGTITQQDNSLFRALMQNDSARDRFLTRMGELLATNLSSQSVVDEIYGRYNALSSDMDAQCARWGKSRATWNRYVENMVEYAEERPGKLVGYLASAFSLTDEQTLRYFGDARDAAAAYVRPGT